MQPAIFNRLLTKEPSDLAGEPDGQRYTGPSPGAEGNTVRVARNPSRTTPSCDGKRPRSSTVSPLAVRVGEAKPDPMSVKPGTCASNATGCSPHLSSMAVKWPHSSEPVSDAKQYPE